MAFWPNMSQLRPKIINNIPAVIIAESSLTTSDTEKIIS